MLSAWNRFLLLLFCAGIGLCLHSPLAHAQEATPEEIAAAEMASVPQVIPGIPEEFWQPGPMAPGFPGSEVPVPSRPPYPRFWGEVDFLAWFIDPGPLPIPVLTRGDPTDPIPGALGQPGTQVLFGNEDLDYGVQAGVRLALGTWFDRFPRIGAEIGGFWLSRQSVDFVANADATGNPPTFVPVFRPELGREGSFTIADPLILLQGSAIFNSQSHLWGLEANSLFSLRRNTTWDVSLLGGMRYLVLEEDFAFTAFLRDPIVDVDTTLRDLFATENRFFGGQVGSRVRWRRGRWTLDLISKVAFGVNQQTVFIDGSLTQAGTGVPFPGTTPGGLFTQPTNIGTQSRDAFVIIPQGTFKLDFELAPRLHLFAGYDFLWWSSVVRPGNQIDREINRTQQGGGILVGPARPMPLFNTGPFWAHGVNFGVAVRY